MKILIVDNNLHINTYPQGIMIKTHLNLHGFLHSKIIKPTDLNYLNTDFDKVILTGSMAYVREEKQWMEDERILIDKCISKKTPILGICFGAQLLARHLFGKQSIQSLPFAINGSIKIKHNNNILFKDIPEETAVIATHYEGFKIPKKHIIATSKEWPAYAFSYPGNIFGIQFHPELSGIVGKLFVKLQRQLYNRNIYQDFSIQTSAKEGRQLLKNFLNL